MEKLIMNAYMNIPTIPIIAEYAEEKRLLSGTQDNSPDFSVFKSPVFRMAGMIFKVRRLLCERIQPHILLRVPAVPGDLLRC